jgi:signal transduction histidine kinase
MNFSLKLVLLFLLTAIAIALILHFSTLHVFKEHFKNNIRPHLHQYFHYIYTEIGTPPNLEIAQRLSDTFKIKIIIKGSDLSWASDGKITELPKINLIHSSHQEIRYESGRYRGNFVIRITNPLYSIIFVTQHDRDLPSLWKQLFKTLVGILLVLGLLYLLIRWMISPLKQIQQSITRIGSGELDHRIAIKRNDEFGKLSNEINAMADDIKNMLEAKRQLLLAISHELRSPITRAKVALSLMEDCEFKDGLQQDMEEIELMISELLEAERFNNRHQVLNLSNTNINQLISYTITKHYPNESIIQKLDHSIAAQSLDEARLQFVIKNLISNALKHRKQATDKINITTYQTKNQCCLTIEDHGKGIPEKHIPYLTEPFYRVDPSRQRETGGYGLGLYLVKMIVEAHHGELIIESQEKLGTKVSIRFTRTMEKCL